MVLLSHSRKKGAWAQRAGKTFQLYPQLDIGKKKSLISVFWSPEGLHSLVALPPDATYDSTFFCQSILPNIKTGLCTGRRRRTLRGIILHMDNARPLNSKISRDAIEATKAKRVEHPPYSPDLAPSDFFLFGALKVKLSGSSFSTEQDLISLIRQKFQEISKQVLVRAYQHWSERLQWVIDNEGEYYQSS